MTPGAVGAIDLAAAGQGRRYSRRLVEGHAEAGREPGGERQDARVECVGRHGRGYQPDERVYLGEGETGGIGSKGLGGTACLLEEERCLRDFLGRHHPAAGHTDTVLLGGQLGRRGDTPDDRGGITRIAARGSAQQRGDEGEGRADEKHFHSVPVTIRKTRVNWSELEGESVSGRIRWDGRRRRRRRCSPSG